MNKKRIVMTTLLLISLVPCLNAQKKEMAQARAFIKSGKSLDKAETMMRKLLNDSSNQSNLKIHLTLCDALRKQYEVENEKMYLKQKVDTVAMFGILRRLFVACQTLDSLEIGLLTSHPSPLTPENTSHTSHPSPPTPKNPKYRDRHAAYLDTYRKNLRSAASFFMRQQKYREAFDFNHLYIDCMNQPLFASYHYPDSPIAAYWALFSGYKLGDYDMTMKYADMAMKDSIHLEYTLQYLAETYQKQDNMSLYEKTLTDGFNSFGESPYFFSKLMDFYNRRNRPELAMQVVERALEKNDTSELFLFAKSTQLLNMGDYQPCIAICDTLISRNPTMADAHYNAGVAYLNLAFETEKDTKLKPAKKREQLRSYYSAARPYMERYRELRREEKEKWAAALYNIYLNLNMGKEFLEIDRLLRE